MCGIAGYFGNFSETSLREAGQLLAHRGPDGSGVFLDESGAGLIHRRLSIIDLSSLGAQPMQSPDGSIVITYNGEIYNYRELREDLERRGVRFRSQSDTEVILQLYLAEGDAMLARLNGIFAFAVWDRRDQSALVARDALGVKPLYYAATPRGFAFASEIKALLPLVPEARELDPIALHRYLTFLWCPGERTPLRAVRKVLPGEAIRIRGQAIERRWFWYELPSFQAPQQTLTEAEAITGTVDHVRQAVHRQLVADVPVGAFLSGGLDSSAIVAFAREQMPAIHCFTIDTGIDDPGFVSDLPYARRVARHLQVPLDVITVDSTRMAADLEQMIWQLDEPLADPAPLSVLYISRLAKQHGIKVLLSGTGGDDLFSGYRRHVALSYERFWQWLPRRFRAGLESVSGRANQQRAVTRRLARMFRGAGEQPASRMINYFRWADESTLRRLYSPDLRNQLSEPADLPMRNVLDRLPRGVSALSRMLALEQLFFLADHNLIYTDKMSMAVGVEARVPYLDVDLVEFASRIPDRLKQKGRVGKWVLKQAMAPYLPADIIHRPKTGFGVPLRRWMSRELKPLVHDVLSDQSLSSRGLFAPEGVRDLIQRNDRGQVDAAYTLLSLMSIEMWCRKFIDGRPIARATLAS